MSRVDIIDLTQDLVSIPSHVDETEAGAAFETWLRRETDADVRRDDVGNVFATKTGTDTDETDGEDATELALVGHHDVVPPDERQVDGGDYVVEERDGRLYGRGTADMKGALAAAAVAFRDVTPRCRLTIASFVGEEVGGIGAQHAIEAGFEPDYAIVGEGSTNYSGADVTDVAVAHRGRRGSTITAHGTPAHASEPAAGVNAIYRGTDAIDCVRTLSPPTVTVTIGETTENLSGIVTVTEIDGGTAMNVIPDSCTITVDERTVPGESSGLSQVGDRTGIDWQIDQAVPPMQCRDDEFATAVLEATDAAQSNRPTFVTKPHVTDAGWLAAAGTECVIVGPSEPGEAHTATESVSIDVLERCARTYRRLAEEWTG